MENCGSIIAKAEVAAFPYRPPLARMNSNSAYRAALAGQLALGGEKHATPTPRTIAALILSYMHSAAYLGLRQTTKIGYASRIETLRAKHGHRTVAGLTRQRILTGILQPYAGRPGAALGILKFLRILLISQLFRLLSL